MLPQGDRLSQLPLAGQTQRPIAHAKITQSIPIKLIADSG
jgi:hypothetical protein